MKEFFLYIPLCILGALSDWYGKKYVGEQFDEDDFDILKPFDVDQWNRQHDPNYHDDLLNCPPVGCKEWEDWVDGKI